MLSSTGAATLCYSGEEMCLLRRNQLILKNHVSLRAQVERLPADTSGSRREGMF